MIQYKEMTECVACGSTHLQMFCSLGKQPLANNLKNSKEDADELFPLEVNVCKDCFHSQLTIAVDRDVLYKHYLYVSGTSTTLAKEFDDVAELIHQQHPKAKRVLDVACNDGTFLRSFRKYNLELWGIDPARNLIDEISDTDMHLYADYFPPTKAEVIIPVVDIITCFNVVAHVPDPLEMLSACNNFLTEDGTIYIQTSQKEMILNGEFDTIYHEHHSFFSINSMRQLASRAGFKLHDVITRPVHGKSYLFVIRRQSDNDKHIDELIRQESQLYDIDTYVAFREKANKNKERLVAIINDAKSKNQKVVGYGAAAKSVVMSNFHGITHDYIADDSPWKLNKIIAGVNTPVYSSDVLKNEKDDLLIIIYAWNWFDEIAAKIKQLRPNNNDYIVPSIVKEI